VTRPAPVAFAPAVMRHPLAFVLAGAPLLAQGTVLDVVDGETLYQGGNLLCLSTELDREEVLRRGGDRVDDPFASHRYRVTTTMAWQYGLRNNVQLGVAASWSADEAESLAGSSSAAGVGDLELLGKWRFKRWDGPGYSINTSLLGSLSLPTGDDDVVEGGGELEPERQLGSGGLDPSVGLAITPEPGRWRFNAAILRQLRTDTDDDGDRMGHAWFAELAIGNRFWLEPYPGPFMRLDVFVHWFDEERDRADGASIVDSGGERVTVGAKWAFRPRPSLDFQVSGEVPIWRDVNGTQLDDDWSVVLAVGYRF
jgi:hypothetical protein